MYDKVQFGSVEPALVGPHRVEHHHVAFGADQVHHRSRGTTFGREQVHHAYAAHEVGFGDDGDDQLTLGMSGTSTQIMSDAMDIQPFQNISQPGGSVSFGIEPALIRHAGARFGIEYGDMSMSTFGDPPSSTLSFGHETGCENDGGGATMGADAPDYGAGNQGAPVDNYLSPDKGGGDPFAVAAFGFEQYELHESGEEAHRWAPGAFGWDHFGGSAFGAENPAMVSHDLPGAADLMAAEDGENMSFQPVGTDPYDAPEQDPTLRNPVTQFGFEDAWYSGFGPAAIIG